MPVSVQAATATGSFTAQITIEGACIVATTNSLNFGNAGVISANIDQATTFQVQCTSGTAYDVGLNAGTGAGANTTTRKMTFGSDTVDYQMFSDVNRTVNWGDDFLIDTVGDTGDGSPQTFTIYGRVPPQATPGAGTYTDTVTITVQY